MKIHHLSPGAMQPPGGALFDGRAPLRGPANLVCHCLLVETPVGLVLVDTGLVSHDAKRSAHRLGAALIAAFAIRLDQHEAAAVHIARLGLDPADVKHIVMTHLDFDHVGGLPDFPGAKIHLSRTEAAHARRPRGPREALRYAAFNTMGRHDQQEYGPFVAEFFGLPATYLDDIPAIMLVWLPGHSSGHCGVAIDLGRGQWLLHAGDAILNAHELEPDHPSTPTGARLLQWSLEASQRRRRQALAELRRIHRDHGDHVQIICTHDPALLARSRPSEQARQPTAPARAGG